MMDEQTQSSISLAKWVLLVGIILVGTSSYGQSLELGGFVGVSNYNGELQDTRFDAQNARPAYGIFSRINFSKNVALRTQYFTSEITGTDHISPGAQSNRNLNFRTSLQEFGVQLELTLVAFGGTKKTPRAKSYIFGGVSGLYFNPQAQYNGDWVDLQPLGTEGQGMSGYDKKYSRYAIVCPLGMGFKVNVSKVASLGLELGIRKTYTDYLDDVSSFYPDLEQLKRIDPLASTLSYREPEVTGVYGNPTGLERGNPANKDIYFFAGVTVSFYLCRF
ncbi:MAG: hypothetical protein KDC24_11025 [Saprospiraceae bacterium]|nr:hypothetical protein [Saprospiraceae bacterium]